MVAISQFCGSRRGLRFVDLLRLRKLDLLDQLLAPSDTHVALFLEPEGWGEASACVQQRQEAVVHVNLHLMKRQVVGVITKGLFQLNSNVVYAPEGERDNEGQNASPECLLN